MRPLFVLIDVHTARWRHSINIGYISSENLDRLPFCLTSHAHKRAQAGKRARSPRSAHYRNLLTSAPYPCSLQSFLSSSRSRFSFFSLLQYPTVMYISLDHSAMMFGVGASPCQVRSNMMVVVTMMGLGCGLDDCSRYQHGIA